MVVRDSQGRIRTERVVGEFKRDTEPDAGSTVEGHIILICDPIAEMMTQIDTATSTARIIHSRPSAPRATGLQPVTRRSFCSARLPTDRSPGRFQVQDLGDQTIEGVDARGQSITMPMQGMTAGEESPNGERTSELWCSDSLSAIVLTVAGNTKTGVKSTVAMRNIERSEPDPALFQIPSDYAVTESVAQPRERGNTNAAPNEPPTQQP